MSASIKHFDLVVEQGGTSTTHRIAKFPLILGRSTDADISINVRDLSRQHLKFDLNNSQLTIEDLGSANGTFVGHRRLEAKKPELYKEGSILRLGANTNLSIYAVRETAAATNLGSVDELLSDNKNSPTEPEPFAEQKSKALNLEGLESKVQRPPDDKALQLLREEKLSLINEISKLRGDIKALKGENEEEKSNLYKVQLAYAQKYEELEGVKKSFAELKVLVTQLKDECEELKRDRDMLLKEHSEAKKQLIETSDELSRTIVAAKEKADQFATEEKRRQLEWESFEAEQRLKKLQISAATQEVEANHAVMKKELTVLGLQKKSIEEDLMSLHEERAAFEAKLKTDKEQIEELRAQHKVLEVEKIKVNREVTELEAKREEIESEINAAKAKHEQKLQEAAEYSTTLKAKALEEVSLIKSKLEKEAEATSELRRSELEAESKRRKEEITREFEEKTRKLDRELAELKVRELKNLERLTEEFNTKVNSRKNLLVQEFLRTSTDLIRVYAPAVKPDALNKLTNELSESLRYMTDQILSSNGDYQPSTQLRAHIPTFNPQAAKQAQGYWKRLGIALAIAATATVVSLVFPSIPAAIKKNIGALFSPNQRAADAFVESVKAARARRPKFNPDMDKQFRESYTDNILYTLGYSTLKTEDNVQKLWVTELNKYLINELQLDERVIVDYISTEATLVKDLLKIRENITPPIADTSIQKMRGLEQEGVERLKNVLRSPASFEKVKSFERNFYEKFALDLKDAP